MESPENQNKNISDGINYDVPYVSFRQPRKKTHFCCFQSGEEEMGMRDQGQASDKQTLTQTIDSAKGMNVEFDSPMTQLSSHLFSPDAELSKFLTRPVLIKSYTWTEGGTLSDNFSPWLSYLNQPIIKNKLQNYYVGRMNLHLKIMINASPFYYGAALVAYRPSTGLDPAQLNPLDSTHIIGLSQRPHVWIYPQTSQGGEMVLPFIYHFDAVDLTSANEVSNLGDITVKSLTLLQNANSVVAGDASVRIYAYASDIQLGGPTYKAVLQADEYGKGPVSGAASAVANISRSLEGVPIIGKFAKATTLGASAVSSIASLFGFTDVPVITDVSAMKNLPFHSITSAHIGEPVTKLCLDPKNEVTIDNSVIGVSVEDELAISHFVNRYSYIGKMDWSPSTSVDSLLWSGRVQPNLFNPSTTPAGPYGSVAVVGTPMSHVAQLFRYWRGSVTFKITAIASKFHRGRYVVTWDPTADISANVSYVGTSFTKIVDIAEESEIEVTIPYTQPYPFCLSDTYSGNVSQPYGTSYVPHIDRYDNGILTIRVFTKQTSPVATADIQLLVSVKGGSDLEFAMPRELPSTMSPFAYQSDVTTDSRSTMHITNSEEVVDRTRYLVSFGEPVLSLRSLLRRAALYSADIVPYPTTAPGALLNFIGKRSVYPIAPGFDPNGVHFAYKSGTVDSLPYNFVNYTPLVWIASCFVARRGSIIHHLNMNSGDTADGYITASFSTKPRLSTEWNGSDTLLNSSSNAALTRASLRIFNSGQSGTDMTTGYVMPAISVSYPHNTPTKFMLTNPKFSVLGAGADHSDNMTMEVGFTSRDAEMTQVLDYVQIGTDFSVGFFVNVPVVYVSTSVPIAP